MPTYEVTVRGSTQLGEVGALDLEAADDLAPHQVDAVSSEAAAAHAIEGLSRKTAPMLVYVLDDAGAVVVYWPSGKPVTYNRREALGTDEGYCFIQVAAAQCEGLGTPKSETAVFADGAMGSAWVCDPCARIVAPEI